MTKELNVLENYLNALEREKEATEALAKKVFEILKFIYKNDKREKFWLGDEIYFTYECVGFHNRKNIIYFVEGTLEVHYRVITTDYRNIKRGYFKADEFEERFYVEKAKFCRAEEYETCIYTINKENLLYIAKNLKKWIKDYIAEIENNAKEVEAAYKKFIEEIEVSN